jgi:L-glyceraldehyde 3-phosphate reductase
MCEYLNDAHVPCVVYQSRCNMLDDSLTDEHKLIIADEGFGYTAFSPLANGLLSGKYLKDIPADSRAAQGKYLKAETITPELRKRLNALNDIAAERSQSLSQMAIAWLLNRKEMTSVIIGPRTLEQLNDCAAALHNTTFSSDELRLIQSHL